jgi:hypothetical protein
MTPNDPTISSSPTTPASSSSPRDRSKRPSPTKRRVGNHMDWYSTATSPFGRDVGAPAGGGFAVNVFVRGDDGTVGGGLVDRFRVVIRRSVCGSRRGGNGSRRPGGVDVRGKHLHPSGWFDHH